MPHTWVWTSRTSQVEKNVRIFLTSDSNFFPLVFFSLLYICSPPNQILRLNWSGKTNVTIEFSLYVYEKIFGIAGCAFNLNLVNVKFDT